MRIIPEPALVWLVGPSGAGKSTWAAERFSAGEVLSSDALRAMVGTGTADLDASADAFEVLERMAQARLDRRLNTVIDTLGHDDDLRERLRRHATVNGLPSVAVVFDTAPELCRSRNRARAVPVPAKVLTSQLRRHGAVLADLADAGWPIVTADQDLHFEPSHLVGTTEAKVRHAEKPRDVDFHLVVSNFDWAQHLGRDLSALATAAEEIGFTGLAVMDHLIQIPQVGRRWEPMPEAYTTLAFLAGVTDRLALEALVTNITLRHPALLAKMIATLDVLSNGRARCGLGAGWFEQENRSLGIPFDNAGRRLDLVEDAARLLPLMWGPGGKPFEGRLVSVPEATCYPRPIQEMIPIIIGGGGERRTLRLVAEHAQGCNLGSDPAVLRDKLDVLRGHCQAVGRDFEELLITVLDITVCGRDRAALSAIVERRRGRRSAEDYRKALSAGTVEDQIGRYRLLSEMGVREVYVSLDDLEGVETLESFAGVVSAFR